jgi:hypothetical protein
MTRASVKDSEYEKHGRQRLINTMRTSVPVMKLLMLAGGGVDTVRLYGF